MLGTPTLVFFRTYLIHHCVPRDSPLGGYLYQNKTTTKKIIQPTVFILNYILTSQGPGDNFLNGIQEYYADRGRDSGFISVYFKLKKRVDGVVHETLWNYEFYQFFFRKVGVEYIETSVMGKSNVQEAFLSLVGAST